MDRSGRSLTFSFRGGDSVGVTWHVQGRRRLIASLLSSCLSANQGETGSGRGPRLPRLLPRAGRFDEGHTGHYMDYSRDRCLGEAKHATKLFKFAQIKANYFSFSAEPLKYVFGQPVGRTNAIVRRENRRPWAAAKKGHSFIYPRGREGRPWSEIRVQKTLVSACAEKSHE